MPQIRELTHIPFGTTGAPLRAVRMSDKAYVLELADVNGVPILTLEMDMETGTYVTNLAPGVLVMRGL